MMRNSRWSTHCSAWAGNTKVQLTDECVRDPMWSAGWPAEPITRLLPTREIGTAHANV